MIRVTILGLFETFVCGHKGSHYTSHITHITECDITAGEQKPIIGVLYYLFLAGCDIVELYVDFFLGSSKHKQKFTVKNMFTVMLDMCYINLIEFVASGKLSAT